SHDYIHELVMYKLYKMRWALEQIQKRFKAIKIPAEFLDTDFGLEKLDSICMQLINIGEALKRIDKITEQELLMHYPQIEWKKVMGMRDIITHHYFDIDAETVFAVCNEHIPELEKTLTKIRRDIA